MSVSDQKEKKSETSLKETSLKTKDSPADRRYLPRWEIENRILYRKEDDVVYHECTTKDLHCGGVCFFSKEAVQAGRKVTLTIYLTDDIAIHLKGETAWIQPVD